MAKTDLPHPLSKKMKRTDYGNKYEILLEEVHRLRLLFQYLDVERDKKGRDWQKLAVKLARRYVPGFQFEKAGRPATLDSLEALQDRQALLAAKTELCPDQSDINACNILLKKYKNRIPRDFRHKSPNTLRSYLSRARRESSDGPAKELGY